MTFKPILAYSDFPSWNGGVTDNGLLKATGDVEVSYSENIGEQVNYMGKHGTISLGKIPLKDLDKSATILGGYQSGSQFKAKAYDTIPESRMATKITIIEPDNISIGKSHGGRQ